LKRGARSRRERQMLHWVAAARPHGREPNWEAVAAQVAAESPASGGLVSSTCGSVLRAHAAELRRQKGQERGHIQEFVQGLSGPGLEEIRAAVSAHGGPGASLSPVPDSSMTVLDVQWGSGAAVPRVVSLAAGSTRSQNLQGLPTLSTALDVDWQQKHALIRHADQPRVGGGRAEEKPSRCWKAGRCLCRGPGRKIGQVRNQLHRLIRLQYPRTSAARSGQLARGLVVLVLEGEPLGGAAEGAAVARVAWQVSLMRFSPFEPVFQVMEIRQVSEAGDLDLEAPRACVAAGRRGRCRAAGWGRV